MANEEIKIEDNGNRIVIYSEGRDGSLYERTIYLKDKEENEDEED